MKEENVIKYYVLCNKLKNLIRTGWKDWNVKKERLESVAEHIYGVLHLAIAMKFEFNYDVDLLKVILMLAVHESEEIFIGDLTRFQISKTDKNVIGHKAVHFLFSDILSAKEIEDLILEFDEGKSKEAFFAYQCDKLECDLQAKLYDEDDLVDLNNQQGNLTINDPIVKSFLDKGMSFGEMWLNYGLETYPYDDNFKRVSNYALNNKIS